MSAAPAPGFLPGLFRLDGKAALIIGGRGELAEVFAATLADLGCDLALASRKASDCADIAQEIADRFGRRAIGLRCNIADEDEVEAAVEAVVAQFGRIDILINNAGASWWGLPEEIPLSGWKKVIDVNLTGTFLAARAAAKRMIAQGGGVIVNIASVGAFLSYRPQDGQVTPYTTSKAAVVHLTADLAAQWADHNIRVNAIAPGSVESGMTNTVPEDQRRKLQDRILLRRYAKPVEIAGALALLVSEAGGFITGQTILVDGGQSLT